MYAYRQMTKPEREAALAYRRLVGFPLHEPPHFHQENTIYLLTAANYEHRPVMADENRRKDFEHEFLQGMASLCGTKVFAWVILPNHYHVLARVDLAEFRSWVGRLHNRTSTRWNRQDGTPGRRVWYRFADRGIRSERHFWAAANYIHGNPVKHGHVSRPDEWRCSSIHLYIEEHGPDVMSQLERKYPVLDFGRGWDW